MTFVQGQRTVFVEEKSEPSSMDTNLCGWLPRIHYFRLLRKRLYYIPLSILGLAFACHFTVRALPFVITVCMFGAGALVMSQLYKRSSWLREVVEVIGLRRCYQVSASFAFAIMLWISQGHPVHAQFFNAAELYFNQTFTGIEATTTVVFGVIRAIFLIYIAVSLVRVIQAARNDDDWQQMARSPVIIVMAVVLGDVLTNLVIGAGGGPGVGGG